MSVEEEITEQKVTIRTVSKHAQVSIATVSRVLNAPWSVTEEKRERVLKSMRALDYSPNPIARALGTNKAHAVAIAVPNIVNPCLAEIIRGVIEELEENQFDVLIFDSNQDIEREEKFVKVLHDKLIDGVIFAAISTPAVNYAELAKKTAVVVIDQPEFDDEIDSLFVDDAGGMCQLVDHIKELGHTDIGFLSGAFTSLAGRRRTNCFIKAMEIARLRTSEQYIVECEWTMDGGAKGITTLLSLKNRPTAVIAASDLIAIGALGTAYSLGYRIPRDISIAGFDHAPWGAYSIPPLTTLDYPNYLMGKRAAHILLQRIQQPQAPKEKIVYPLPLLIRSSTGVVTIRKNI